MAFKDRREAGRLLAEELRSRGIEDPLVLALPRGGVPVGFEVARALGAPLDVVVARKLGAPGQPELGIGAVAPGGVRVLDERTVTMLGVTHAELDQLVADETQEMERRLLAYRGDPRLPRVRGRNVVLVDDGLATGVTARAALRAVRAAGAASVVLAVPVGAASTADALREEADDVVVVSAPEDFRAVGLWYEDFRQTTDEEVVSLLETARGNVPVGRVEREVAIPVGDAEARADLVVPEAALGVVVFAHGSGSGRKSPRNREVARALHAAGFGTLLLDLLTPPEEARDAVTREHRFDIPLLARRLVAAMDWLAENDATRALAVGLYGASTGAAAALRAAAERPSVARAVVSRGGRPDLAGDALPLVEAPTLLMVGSEDAPVLELNRAALARMRALAEIVVVPGASHLFEEPGALDEVSRKAADWFAARLAPGAGVAAR